MRKPKIALTLVALVALLVASGQFAHSAGPGGACLAKDQVRQAQPPSGGSAVVQICSSGESVAQASGVDLIDPSGTENANAQLARGQVLPVLTTIGAPAATIIDIESPAGVVARIYGGARLRILAQSDRSESYGNQAGQVGFDVPQHRLDFMDVVTQSLLAIVKGTNFDVIVDANGTKVNVVTGLVAVGRGVNVKLDAENKLLSCIRIMDLLSAGQSGTYPVQPALENFANQAAALAYFQQQLAAAKATGDKTFIDDATANLNAIQNAKCPLPGGGTTPGTNSALLYGLGGAAVLAGAIVLGQSSQTSAPHTPTPIVTPSPTPIVTPSPTPIVTPSPTPIVTPSPTPIVTPSPKPSPTPIVTPSPAPSATPIVTPSPTPIVTPSPTPVVTPSPTPIASAAPSTVTLKPSTLNFITTGSSASQTTAASETSYSGSFTASGTSCSGIATISPSSSTSVFTVTPAGAGKCTFTVTGAPGQTATLSVTVTLSGGIINSRDHHHGP
jgi:outer membrane biosynthesis protein TonB